MTESWTTNTTLEQIAHWIRPLRRVVVLTHAKPDGDAIGSTLAIAAAINALRPDAQSPTAQVWYFGAMPPFAAKLIGDAPARHFLQQSHPGGEPDGIVITDTGSWNQLEHVKDWLGPRADRAALIDHHRHGDPASAARRFIDPGSAAACQIAAELARLLLKLPSVTGLPVGIARLCYLGLATDTGWFRHSNTTPSALRLAADLLDAGVDAPELYRIVEQSDREARVRLMARALAGMQLHDRGRFAFMSLTRADFAEFHAEQGDAGGFADHAQAIESVSVVAMFTESDPDSSGAPVTKVSLRSKDGEGGVDVNAVARRFDGGGHIRAAGARIAAPIDQARQMVLDVLREAV
ncbi:MAG: DHH family phosphoesterase [Phycisphaeraceae bacterium]|nr:DHH family phosphoesterase [Phycisphaeraceae bacterium]